MSPRLPLLLAALALLGLGAGFYGRFVRTPPPLADVEATIDDRQPLPAGDEYEALVRTDAVAMLEKCLARYAREVRNGLAVTLVKKERVRGEPPPPREPPEEVISLYVRGDVPDEDGKHCIEVLMKWRSGCRQFLGSEIRGALYSERPGPEGTDGKVVTWRPTALLSISAVPAADPLARGQSRYCLRDAGIYRGTLRTYTAWKQRQQAGTLRTEYQGKKPVSEVGGRLCYVVERSCDAPEVDSFEIGGRPDTDPQTVAREGFTRVRVMIDVETWMQLGTELYRPDGALLAAYYFRDPVPNPDFAPDTFTTAGLKRK